MKNELKEGLKILTNSQDNSTQCEEIKNLISQKLQNLSYKNI